MKRRMLPILWVVFVLFHLSSRSATAFECGIFPGESPNLEAPAGDMVLRKIPSAISRIVKTISPGKGTTVKWKNVRFRTLSPGIFVARTAGSIEGANYGPMSYLSREHYYSGGHGGHQVFQYTKGDSIEYLQYRAEGSAFIRINGAIVAADLLSKRAVPFKEVKRPRVELWVEVISEAGKPMGWYQVPQDKFHQPKAGSLGPGPEFMP